MTTTEIAERFGASDPCVVRRHLVKMGIARRPVGLSRHSVCIVPFCGKSLYKIKHQLTIAGYGRYCYEHYKAHRKAICHKWWLKNSDANYRKQFRCPRCGGPKSDFNPALTGVCYECYLQRGRINVRSKAMQRQLNQIKREERKWIRVMSESLKNVRRILSPLTRDAIAL
jgi:hypothetical protein